VYRQSFGLFNQLCSLRPGASFLIPAERLSNVTESTRKGTAQGRWGFPHLQKKSPQNHERKPKRGTLSRRTMSETADHGRA